MLPNFIENPAPEVYYETDYVVLDFETDTSHGDYGSAVHEDNGLILACWKRGPSGPMRKVWGSEFMMGELVADIEQAKFLICHDAKYELMWLSRCGLDLSKVLVFDTKIAEYVLLGNLATGDDHGMRPRSTSLDMCCRRRGWEIKDPVVDIMIHNSINPVSLPKAWLQGRCEQDVDTTERLYQDQLERLSESNRLAVQYTRCLFTPVLSALEFVGMSLDYERVAEAYEEHVVEFNRLNSELDVVTGGINWRSTKQVAEFLYDTLEFDEPRKFDGTPRRTKKGARMTDKTTLQNLKAKTPRQKEFLKLRGQVGKVAAALSKNLEFFIGVCEEQDGIFKAVFNQTRTATHRLSSSGIPTLFEMFDKAKTVQFQNLPRAFKPLFKARREGWLMAEADGMQLEFRAAAHQGKDEAAKTLIVTGGDIHALTMMVKHDLTEEMLKDLQENDEKKYKLWRTGSKSWTFQPLYGGEGTSKKQKEYAAAFRKQYPGIAQAQEGWANEVLNTKKLVTEWGMRYYWPKSKLVKRGRDRVLNIKSSVYNYPIQAFATAEIIPIAVTYFWHRVIEEGLEDVIVLVNTIHDSIICEVHPEHQDDFKRIAKQSFTRDVYNYLDSVYGISFDFVPLGVGITLGEFWTEGKEESYNIYYDGTEEQVE